MAILVDTAPLRDNPDFRNLFLSRTAMLFGAGTALFALPIDVYRTTGSVAVVGAAEAVGGAAFLVGFLVGGVLADRMSRGRLVRMSRLVNSVAFAGLTVNAASWNALWPVFVLLAANGIAAGIGISALTALLTTLVERDQLHAVGALNTLAMRASHIVAPVLGGALVAVAGAAWAYGTAAALALVTYPVLHRVRALDTAGPTHPERPIRALVTGYRFIGKQPVVRGVMTAGIIGMLGGGTFVLFPALVEACFGNEPIVVGLMFSAGSAGTVAGTLASGRLRDATRPGLLLLTTMVIAFVLLAAVGAVPILPLVLVLLFAAGAVNAVEEILRYTLLQLNTPPDLLGRVNGAFAAQNMAGIAVGVLIAGTIGEWLAPQNAILVINLVLAAISLITLAVLTDLRREGPSTR